MPVVGGFPYREIQFTKDGAIHDPAEVVALLDTLDAENVTDLIAISHGWNNTMPEARDLYRALLENLRQIIDGGHGPDLARRSIAVLAVLWPSKKFADADVIASGAADIGGSPADAEILAELARLEAALDDPAATAKLRRARALVPRLDGDPAAQKRFANLVRGVLPRGGTGDQDTPAGFFNLSGDRVMERLRKPLPLRSVTAGPADAGALVEVGEIGGPPAGGAAFLGGFFSGVQAGALKLVNYSTYYLMKERAGTIGTAGLAPLLRQASDRRAGLKLHLVGHSFGGRLVTAAAAACADPPALKLATMTLLQAAFSHHGFARHFQGARNGFFRRVVDEQIVTGPTVITHTRNDTAVGYLYPIVSLLAGDDAAELGDANDPFGGIGRNGAQRTPEATDATLIEVGGHYGLAAGRISNLEASAFISDHGAVTGPQVAYAIATAIAVT